MAYQHLTVEELLREAENIKGKDPLVDEIILRLEVLQQRAGTHPVTRPAYGTDA